MKSYKRILTMLAALIAATTGAWADAPKVYTSAVAIADLKKGDILAAGFSLTGNYNDDINFKAKRHKLDGVLNTMSSCSQLSAVYSIDANCVIKDGYNQTFAPVDENNQDGNAWLVTATETGEGITHIYLSGYTYDPNVVPVDWDATTKQGSFAMPGADVELEAEYYDDATVTGTATAAAGVRAGDDKALVGGLTASGGTLVWAVTANNVTTAPADADFAEGNNTAKGLTAEGTYRVWYFAAGDSEHSPSEPTYTDVTVAAALFEGAGTEESPYLVNTYEDLKKFSALVNDGTLNGAGIYFRLDADIDCTGMTDFVPIGTASHPFKGKFDGNSKTISGLEFIINDSYSSDPAGLFGELNHENGMIKDLTLSGCTFKGGDMTGAIVTELLNGTIQNCEVNSCIIETGNEFTFPYCGGIAGYIQKGVISNCTVNGGTITASST